MGSRREVEKHARIARDEIAEHGFEPAIDQGLAGFAIGNEGKAEALAGEAHEGGAIVEDEAAFHFDRELAFAAGKTPAVGEPRGGEAVEDGFVAGRPQRSQTPRGEIRVRQEQMLADAAKAGRFQVIIIRAGDFYGPDNSGDWFDQAMMLDVAKGKIHHMGDLGMGHAWAYLPDLGEAFAKVADVRNSLGAFENFHFAGDYVPHDQMMAAIQKAAPMPLKVSPVPWLIMQAMGLAMPVIREVLKMRYLWTNPMELVDPRLDAILGPDFGTPFEEAVAQAARQFFVSKKAAA